MRAPLVAGNWKMNGTLSSVVPLSEAVAARAGRTRSEVLICPPYIYLQTVSEILQGTSIMLGVQNLSDQTEGAFTGEVSGLMLKDYGCSYAIIGHSERRQIYGETDALVAAKFTVARQHGLIPIVCVGEHLKQREAGETNKVVGSQLEAVLNLNQIAEFANAVIAYEPVWAIGTGRTATPEQAQEVHALIRAAVSARNTEIGAGIRILYGGSVNADNASELFGMEDIDGGLVGGASLMADTFVEICHVADGSVGG